MTDRGMPIAETAAPGACCEACATDRVAAGSAPLQARALRTASVATQPQFVVLEPNARRSAARLADRRVTLAGLLVSVGFLAAAVLAAILPESVRRGAWLPIHLALAGAAGTAVASILPFFVAALCVARALAWTAAVVIGLVACGWVVLSSLAIFVDAVRTGRTSDVTRASVPAVSAR